MSLVTRAAINSGITATLAEVTGVNEVQDYDDLTEGMNNLPAVQVYWEEDDDKSSTYGKSDRMTFGGNVGQCFTFHVDVYARRRSNIGQDMAATLPLVDTIDAKIRAQVGSSAPFGVAIQSFQWEWSRCVFEYGAKDRTYMGARCVLKVETY